jgi:glutamate carboxypeptidase
LPGTSASVTFTGAYPPMAVTAGNMNLLALYSQASVDAGLGTVDAVPAEARGAGDIQFVAPLIDSLDGLGASGVGAHSPDEDLALASVARTAIRTAPAGVPPDPLAPAQCAGAQTWRGAARKVGRHG